MRPQILFPIFSSISNLRGVGEKTGNFLSKLGIQKIADLIFHLPSSIIDRRYSPKLINAQVGKIITIEVDIVEHIAPKTKKQPYKIVCTDDSEQIILSFFKVYGDSLTKSMPVGSKKIISGKLETYNGSLQMSHPDYIVDVKEKDSIFKVEAIYPLTAGLGNRFLSKIIAQATNLVPKFDEWLDKNHLKSMGFASFNESLHQAHNPLTLADLENSSNTRTRLAYDELLSNQLALAVVRNSVKKQPGQTIKGNGLFRKRILDILAFKLSSSQEKVLAEIYEDMGNPSRMHRLLQGDVGSGKTIVSFLAMLNAIEAGYQATIMAPTEILAKQHIQTMQELCEHIDIRVELLSGKIKGKKRTQILEDLKSGKIDILVGTHALFVEDVQFANLGFVVIDEQHRFGVHQRLALSNKGEKTDILVMTATPIPRTLILTAYGDMEYSKINQPPEGRKPTTTSVMSLTKVDGIINSLKKQIDEKKRAYWVCPLVEESEKLDLQAAINRYEILQKTFGQDVGLIHGRMKEKEKDLVMEQFRDGKFKLLVATTVIEVGVNVAEATIMIVEHAERFGLSQLHQLRGRVKRGYKESNCILLYNPPLGETARKRLETMRDSQDGFYIAEEDLKLRGSGEVLGTKQSGFANFKIADMSIHQNLLLTANKDAKMILELDPELKTKRGENLRTLLYLFEQDSAIKTYLAG